MSDAAIPLALLERSPTRLRLGMLHPVPGRLLAFVGIAILCMALLQAGLTGARVLTFVIGGGGLLVLAAGLWSARQVTLVFDRAAGVVHLRARNVLSTQVRAAPLSHLERATLAPIGSPGPQDTETHGDPAPARLVLQFDDRAPWSLPTPAKVSDPSCAAHRLAWQINDWLGQIGSGARLDADGAGTDDANTPNAADQPDQPPLS